MVVYNFKIWVVFAETDVGQASHVAAMEINEDIPPYDVTCKITAQMEDSDVPLQRSARPPPHQEAPRQAMPVTKLYSQRRRINERKHLEKIIKDLREEYEDAMQGGICEVEVAIYLEK